MPVTIAAAAAVAAAAGSAIAVTVGGSGEAWMALIAAPVVAVASPYIAYRVYQDGPAAAFREVKEGLRSVGILKAKSNSVDIQQPNQEVGSQNKKRASVYVQNDTNSPVVETALNSSSNNAVMVAPSGVPQKPNNTKPLQATQGHTQA